MGGPGVWSAFTGCGRWRIPVGQGGLKFIHSANNCPLDFPEQVHPKWLREMPPVSGFKRLGRANAVRFARHPWLRQRAFDLVRPRIDARDPRAASRHQPGEAAFAAADFESYRSGEGHQFGHHIEVVSLRKRFNAHGRHLFRTGRIGC